MWADSAGLRDRLASTACQKERGWSGGKEREWDGPNRGKFVPKEIGTFRNFVWMLLNKCLWTFCILKKNLNIEFLKY